MFWIEALVIAGRPVLITLPIAVVFVWLMIAASYLNPMEFLAVAPIVPILLFIVSLFGFVALAYYLGGKKILKTVKQSGEFNATKNRMSKRGTPYLRRALWTASIVAAFNDPNLHEYYLKKKNEGKHHGTIIGAIARKLIYRIFIVLKDNIPYQCNKCEA